MNWKEFKIWLENSIIENKNSQVKIKPNKQTQYGQLSVVTLTNFCGSLEATLDMNNSYHLFPEFTEWGTFQDLFPFHNTYFGKKVNQEKISRSDYDILEKLFIDWRSEENQEKDPHLQKAISQSIIAMDDLNLSVDELQMQEVLLVSQFDKGNYPVNYEEENVDRGWLTDDNIEYILENDEIVKKIKNIQIKTDIANIYLQLQKAKNGEAVDEDFWKSLDTKKKYIFLPLRVSGNHWSLLLFVNNNEYTGKVNWVYYISSLDFQEIDREVEEISSFLKQTGRKFGQSDNRIINENNLSEMVFQQNPRQPNSWDCGVYLCKFIQFLCENEYYNLNELRITSPEIKAFRIKWKEKIGEDKWCKWDTISSQVNFDDNDEQLQKALAQSLLSEDDDRQLEKAMLLSCRQNTGGKEKESDRKSEEEEEFFDAPQDEKTEQKMFDHSYDLVQKLNERLERIVKEEKSKLDTSLQENLDNLLDAQEQIILLEGNNLEAVASSVEKQLTKFKAKFQGVISSNKLAEICQIKIEITKEIKTKQAQLEKLKCNAKRKLSIDLQEFLEDLLENQKQLTLLENSGLARVISITKQQCQKNKQKLNAKLSEQEIAKLCKTQEELTRLENKQEKQMETKILTQQQQRI